MILKYSNEIVISTVKKLNFSKLHLFLGELHQNSAFSSTKQQNQTLEQQFFVFYHNLYILAETKFLFGMKNQLGCFRKPKNQNIKSSSEPRIEITQ